LRKAALSFARFAALEGIEARDAMSLLIVRDAMVSYPEYVSGTGEFDSVLMAAGGGSIACKAGAEGVHGVAIIPQGVGYVSKVLDGTSRGRSPSTMAALRSLRALSDEQLQGLAAFERPIVYNRAGRAVGEVRAVNFAVEQAS
jgi:L-asparaginase II